MAAPVAPPHPTALTSSSSIGGSSGAAVPVVVLLTHTLPSPGGAGSGGAAGPYVAPTALTPVHGKTPIDQWWEALTAVGLNLTSHVYLVTNAAEYKPFEFWAFGRGIAVSHIINTGATLGDARINLRALLVAIHATFKVARAKTSSAEEPHDVIVIGVDSVPRHPGAAFGHTLSAMLKARKSTMLLQPPFAAAATTPLPSAGSGPSILAYYNDGAESGTGLAVRDVRLSTVSDPTIAPEVASAAGMQVAAAPVVFKLTGHDATQMATAFDAIARAGGADATSVASESFPVEAGLAWLARSGNVQGIALADKFILGAADGTAPATILTSVTAGGGAGAGAGVLSSPLFSHAIVKARAYARVGLVGNPSDGFSGKTLSVTIENFAADVWIAPGADHDHSITLTPHPIYDPAHFFNLRHVSTVSSREGYSGGLRLMQAALHRFFLHCRRNDVELHERGFTATYHTTIPRQVGLAGSSAIVTAFMRALLRFYGFDTEEKAAEIGLSRDQLPSFVLAVESEELGITAGLQDRVVQAYEGAVHMDFDADLVKGQGFGRYTPLSVGSLPPLFLAYAADPSDSGKIHAPVKQRWLAGDREVIEGMAAIASLADEARALATSRSYADATTAGDREAVVHEWGSVFYRNFEGRRRLFGDGALGRDNLRMVAIARECGASAKLPGSGGAIVGVVDVKGIAAAGKLPITAPALPASGDGGAEGAARLAAATAVLREAYLAEGYVFTLLQPHEREA